MITRDNIGEIARFESPEGCAITFYYQPTTPQNKSHREEGILVKDLVRNALREIEKNGRNASIINDLQRIQELAERLHGNGGRAKAIFSCSSQNFWREYDLPPRFQETRLFINTRFHLRPLTAIADVLPRVGVVLADKTKARLYDYWMDELRERERMEWELPRRGRSDGFVGYDAGHAQRHVEHEAMHHYKELADRILELQQGKQWDKVMVGCRNENWPEIERHLHAYTRQAFVGRFHVDPAAITPDELKKLAEEHMREFRSGRADGLLHEALGQSQRDGRGVTGLKRVLQSMERGEMQTLLIGRNFKSRASECPNCGHLDARAPAKCAVCGTPNRHLADVADLLLGFAVRNGIEIIHVNDDPTFDRIGNVAALLRFRADKNTNNALQRAS